MGNGGCYATEPPDPAGTAGRYCGNGGTSGTACSCGTFSQSNPFPFDGVDIFSSTGLIDSVVLPVLPVSVTGQPTVQTWNGSAFVDVGGAQAGVPFFVPPSSRVRIKNIHLVDDIDLGNQAAFPISVGVQGGASFVGSIEAFASTMPVELWLETSGPGGTVTISWVGGSGPFVVQSAPAYSGPWTDAPLTDARIVAVSTGPAASVFRIKEIGGTYSNLLDAVNLPPTSYCTAGTSSNGCIATISAAGIPSASASSGFALTASGVEGQKQGLLFYGVNGQDASPWGATSTSFLCVKAPTQRTATQNSGGTTGQCDGSLSLDWNAYMASHPTALGGPSYAGEVINAQAWYRDPPAAKTTNLSNGLQFILQP
jgi:hypothetical protein